MRDSGDLDKLVKVVSSALPGDQKFIALHEPRFCGNEWEYVKECLDTGWVSSVGKFVDRFEQDLAEYTGVNNAIAVVNGTAALHICLKLAGVEQNDEVLIPSFTFIATANAVSYCGAIPHFADSEMRTLGLDPFKLSNYLRDITEVKRGHCYNKITGRRIKAVVPMHTFGHPVDLDPLMEICANYHIELIEDAAESLGSYYKGQHTGNFGKLSALSFNGNKVITTGGGGAILTNDESLAKFAKHITTTAKIPHKWAFNHDQIGFNYRLPNINAALGCAQLEQLEQFLIKKRALADSYRKVITEVDCVSFMVEPEFAKSNYWLNAILLNKPDITKRDYLLEKLNDQGIMSRPAWTLMHKLPMFAEYPKMDLTIAEGLEMQLINIPSSVVLGETNE
ncbi:LegC family aminotransferase [Paenibacillus oryzisoli]|uniref:Aminotransferase DegT n=1 Tax=Paenibacillus oryzisoli TaxID=1850517 RepID=A0A198A0H1_9BACL|nr:LegC family aminotransferase [Paenibacillus oryzisoli]OAS14518.1 aminotransferase DegT [Paenibacillus oryzisoli]